MKQHREVHPLATASVRPLDSTWSCWTEAYSRAETLDAKIGQLYSCPICKPGVICLLSEAEGISEADTFFMNDEELKRQRVGLTDPTVYTLFGRYDNIGKARQHLAKIAFARLVKHLFKDARERDHHAPSWLHLVSDKDVIEALLYYFRLDDGQHFVNWPEKWTDTGKHQRIVVSEFLEKFAQCGWQLEVGVSSEIRVLFAGYRKQFIEILCALGRLDTLLGLGAGEDELAIVTELALKQILWLPVIEGAQNNTLRKPQTIEEAAYAGSQAGKIAILLREQIKLDKYFSTLRRAYQIRKKADEELGKIQRH